MKFILEIVTFFLIVSPSVFGDVSHILNDKVTTTTPAPPPHPYAFSYAAGRAPGHVDRTHTEVSDGSGVVRGEFAYVDPRQQIRTVKYVADQYGFHPELSHPPQDTAANEKAKARHFALYNKIAEQHANPQIHQEEVADYPHLPVASAAVIRATNKHFDLYEKIAREHARIGAEREAERLAFEATSEPNQIYDDKYYEH